MNALALLIGRILLAAIFVHGGYAKLFAGGVTAVAENLANHGFPQPMPLAYAASAGELIGGLMLVIGIFPRFAAIAFLIYTGALAIIFHNFWAFTDPAQHAQQSAIFYFHLAIMGGMLYVAVFGAGRHAVHRK
jgi:putative oxidoreductase